MTTHRHHERPDSPGDRERAEKVAEGEELSLPEQAKLQEQAGIEATEFEGTIEG